MEAFDKVTEAVTKHEKGNLVYGLSKPADDDVTFYAYAGALPSDPPEIQLGPCVIRTTIDACLDACQQTHLVAEMRRIIAELALKRRAGHFSKSLLSIKPACAYQASMCI